MTVAKPGKKRNELVRHAFKEFRLALVGRPTEQNLAIQYLFEQRAPVIWKIERYATNAELLRHGWLQRPDVVLIDIQFDKVGTLYLGTVKRLLPNAYVAIFGNSSSPGWIASCLLAGVSAYIIQPLSTKEALLFIGHVVERAPFLCMKSLTLLVNAFHHLGEATDPKGLTKRERDVMACLFDGSADKDIAEKLNISPSTAHLHVSRLLKKWKVHERKRLIPCFLEAYHTAKENRRPFRVRSSQTGSP